MKTLMNFLNFFRDLASDALIYGTIMVFVVEAIVFAIARDIDYAGFSLLALLLVTATSGLQSGF